MNIHNTVIWNPVGQKDKETVRTINSFLRDRRLDDPIDNIMPDKKL